MDEEMGDGWTLGIHPDDFDRCVSYYLENFAQRRAFEMEYRLRRHDGVYRWLFDRGVPFTDDSGAFAGFIGSCVDVDDRRRAEEAQTTFLSLIAHELRTPLTSLNTFLESAKRGLQNGQPVGDEMLGKLSRQAEKLGTLTRTLGEALQLERGFALEITVAQVELVQLLQQVVDRYAPRAQKTGHSLTFEAQVQRAPLEADRDRLEQVFGNLIDNALKYSPDGGPIQVRLDAAPGGYRVTVEDRGIGVPAEELPNVTRRYFRASNARPMNFPGVGLGLPLARELVERHGGRLELRSEVGKGTVVEVFLPHGAAPTDR